MQEILLGLRGNGDEEHPIGQATFTTTGTVNWTAPPGVRFVNCLVIGGGDGGYAYRNGTTFRARGGNGGGVRWRNNIPVTPGQTYVFTVGAGGIAGGSAVRPVTSWNLTGGVGGMTSALGISAGSGTAGTVINEVVKGFYGKVVSTVVGTSTGDSLRSYGGDAASLLGSASGQRHAGIDPITGLPSGGGDSYRPGENYGGGGSSYSHINGASAAGARGAIRLIWGVDRAFPDLNIHDM